MGNFFSSENGFFSFLSKVCDIIFLSAIWFLLCIPIITIGPANTALYYATVKVIRRERGYLIREFFKSFKLNFKKGAIIGVITTIMYLVLGFDVYVTWSSTTNSENMTPIFMGIYIAILIILTCFTIYVYPVLSRFDMSLKQLFRITFFMCMRHFLFTIGMFAILAASIVGVLFNFMFIFVIPASATLLSSLLMEVVLKKYTPKSEKTDEETGKDEWYLE